MPQEYDPEQLRADAARRMRELQSRARRPLPPEEHQPEEHQPEERSLEEHQPEETTAEPLRSEKPPESALEALFRDKERAVILALLLLLSGEEGNQELLFALLFLLI